MPSQIRQATAAQFAENQSHGLDVLLSLATPKDVREYARAYDGGSLLARRGGSDRSAYGYSDAPVLPQRSQLSRYVEPRPRPLPRKAPPLERFGEPAPVVTYRPRQWLACLPVAMLIAGSFALHYRLVGHHIPLGALAAWAVVTTITVAQCIMSWCHRPVKLPSALGRVAVVVPCFNEDPELLGRVLESLRWQTRRPDWVIVTDDCSDQADYRPLMERYPEVMWVRHRENLGKKHAQVSAWRQAPHADYIITMDSDSELEPRAVEEIMRPFSDPRVTGVAGVEMARNWNKNILTLAIAARSLAFQLFAMSGQSVARSVLICPGAFSAYPGWLLRKCEYPYLNEKFCGKPCRLGDDTMLTFLALMHGRVIQQPTAFSFPVYPEKIQHHIRQWVRWMRASTIRQLWRLRYLPLTSYGWWFTVWQVATFTAGVAASLLVIFAWPESRDLALEGLAGLFGWPLVLAIRLFTIQRSDQTRWQMIRGIALMPLAALWYLLVLRQIRFWGMLTCDEQGWNTRSKIEVSA